ncbi:MAG: peptidylprolyl isomerase [Deltaproteobacteria bacterium]|nr:peptidylprolyl isomerase [Deltaproteobacteria bacterium]
MAIQKDSHVTMEYTLTLESGEQIDRSDPDRPLQFLCGYSQIIPGLEKELIGKNENESFQVKVPSEEGYGPYQEELLQKIPLTQFPEKIELKVGMSFQTRSPQGLPMTFVIKEIEKDSAVVDLNHPLAGKTLIFDIAIKGVRAGTPEEIEAVKNPSCGSDGSSCGSGCSCG